MSMSVATWDEILVEQRYLSVLSVVAAEEGYILQANIICEYKFKNDMYFHV